MSDCVELIKKLMLSMSDDEMSELSQWIYELFKANCSSDASWNDVVDATSNALKALDSKPN